MINEHINITIITDLQSKTVNTTITLRVANILTSDDINEAEESEVDAVKHSLSWLEFQGMSVLLDTVFRILI